MGTIRFRGIGGVVFRIVFQYLGERVRLLRAIRLPLPMWAHKNDRSFPFVLARIYRARQWSSN